MSISLQQIAEAAERIRTAQYDLHQLIADALQEDVHSAEDIMRAAGIHPLIGVQRRDRPILSGP